MEGGSLNFADAVQGTPKIAECLKKGLQALGANSNKVEVRVTRDLKGSVDIDSLSREVVSECSALGLHIWL